MNWFATSERDNGFCVHVFDEIGIGEQTAEHFLTAIEGREKIQLVINSPGGDSLCALKVCDALRHRNVSARIIGRACSCAVILACAARRVEIVSDARLMIHSPQSAIIGDPEALRSRADYLDKLRAQFLAAIMARTKQSAETVAAWLTGHDTWFSAAEAIKWGFADEIIPPAPVLESLALPKTEGAPEQPTGPIQSEQMFYDLVRACGKIHVRDRKRFHQNVSNLFSQHVTEAKGD